MFSHHPRVNSPRRWVGGNLYDFTQNERLVMRGLVPNASKHARRDAEFEATANSFLPQSNQSTFHHRWYGGDKAPNKGEPFRFREASPPRDPVSTTDPFGRLRMSRSTASNPSHATGSRRPSTAVNSHPTGALAVSTSGGTPKAGASTALRTTTIPRHEIDVRTCERTIAATSPATNMWDKEIVSEAAAAAGHRLHGLTGAEWGDAAVAAAMAGTAGPPDAAARGRTPTEDDVAQQVASRTLAPLATTPARPWSFAARKATFLPGGRVRPPSGVPELASITRARRRAAAAPSTHISLGAAGATFFDKPGYHGCCAAECEIGRNSGWSSSMARTRWGNEQQA